MNRLGILTFLLAPFVAGASPDAAAAPVISISVYAPVQKDSPVQIVSFLYDEHGVQFTLLNASDKLVVGVEIVGISIVPPGCAAVPPEGNSTFGVGYSHRLRIRSGERRVVTERDEGYSLPASLLLGLAGHLKAAYLQVQVGVVRADFVGGTKWNSREVPTFLGSGSELHSILRWLTRTLGRSVSTSKLRLEL
jgi:hypothetical protein